MFYQANVKYPFFVCGEWPEQTDQSATVLKFEEAPKCFMTVQLNSDPDFDDFILEAIRKQRNHSQKWREQNRKSGSQFEIDFSQFSVLRDLSLDLNAAPSSCVLFQVANHLVDEDFDEVWDNFLGLLNKYSKNLDLVDNVNGESVNLKYAIIYQKLQVLNFAISKIKNKLNTSNFAVTSDQLDEIDQIIAKSYGPSENISWNLVRTIRDEALKYKANCYSKKIDPNLVDFKRVLEAKRINEEEYLVEVILNSIPKYLFDINNQIELVLYYFDSISPHACILELVSLLVCEKLDAFNQDFDLKIYSIREKISEIVSEINLLRSQFELFSFCEIMDKFDEINKKVNDLNYKMKVANFLSKYGLNTEILESLIRTGKCEINSKDRAEIVKRMLSNVFRKHKSDVLQKTQVTVNSRVSDRLECRLFVSNTEENVIVATAIHEKYS